MYTRSQKHVPHKEVGPAPLREVAFPHRVDKSNVEAGFSLGYTEPEDGRYNTMSRKSYVRPDSEARGAILERKSVLEAEHRSRHFFLGTPLEYKSEARTALAPPPASAFHSRDPPSLQNRKNALAMNTANFYMNDGDSFPTSTLRQDFKRCDLGMMQTLRNEAAHCRSEQQRTNYALGDQHYVWSSEARSNYGRGKGSGGVAVSGGETTPLPSLRRGSTPTLGTNEVGVPKRAPNQNLQSQFTLGSSDLAEKDGIRSLKQVDFVNHPVVTALSRPHQVDAQRDTFVFGHRGAPINSLYRESFPPTQYAATPSPTPARRL